MNRKSRFVCIAILLVSMLTFCSCVSAEAMPSELASSFHEYCGECGEHASWQYVNHTLVISGYGPMESYASLSVHAPWYDIKEDIRLFAVNWKCSKGAPKSERAMNKK